MENSEVEKVLSNWIAEATEKTGELSPGITPSQWAAKQFLRWWEKRVSEELDNTDSAVKQVKYHLEQLGGWSRPELGDAMHELIHARDALNSLRELLCLNSVC